MRGETGDMTSSRLRRFAFQVSGCALRFEWFLLFLSLLLFGFDIPSVAGQVGPRYIVAGSYRRYTGIHCSASLQPRRAIGFVELRFV
ncbi:hypothetical protein [Prolixibacter denitrificans]|uniref:hypothetical protein n=1 Tax=Prolixibacter denitrificans TaxID=1541063 RepID=UPI0011B29A84|nr:hypothetical protein [Prolixibacter denitrificans]